MNKFHENDPMGPGDWVIILGTAFLLYIFLPPMLKHMWSMLTSLY